MEVTHKTTDEPDFRLNYMQRLWHYRRYLVIESFFFFYLMASVLNHVALKSFPLEKACRVNLGYNRATCMATLDKAELGINCDDYKFDNTTNGASMGESLLGVDSTGFNYTVCKAQEESQRLSADVSGKRAPIGKSLSLYLF